MKNEILSLEKADKNKIYEIVSLESNLSFYEKDRLMSYGFLKDTTVILIRRSLFGTTLQVNIKDCSILIRKKHAKTILIKEKVEK